MCASYIWNFFVVFLHVLYARIFFNLWFNHICNHPQYILTKSKRNVNKFKNPTIFLWHTQTLLSNYGDFKKNSLKFGDFVTFFSTKLLCMNHTKDHFFVTKWWKFTQKTIVGMIPKLPPFFNSKVCSIKYGIICDSHG